MKPNLTESLEFLNNLIPGGPWILTSINLKGDKIDTKTFYPDEADLVKEWVRGEQLHKSNIYFQVNPTRGMDPEKKDRRFKKAKRQDIEGLRVLHVDLDPRAGEDVLVEQDLIKTLAKNPPGKLPPPSVVVWSGGGAQLLWILKEPALSNGSLEDAEDLKLYNLQLERLYGGHADGCHNIDRILRLAGSINFPNEIKRKKGRETVASRVLEYHEDRVYSIDLFTKAPKLQGVGSTVSQSGVQIEVNTSNIKRVDLEDYPSIAPWVKVMIVQGYDTNGANEHLSNAGQDPHKYDSRSEAAWAVICHLVQKEIPDDVIYSIITDQDFKISEHVLNQKSGVERYALRQIQKAKETAIDPLLCELNEKHAVIGDIGGKCRIVSEVWNDALNRDIISFQSFADFSNRYCNQKVQVAVKKDKSPVYMPAGKWWIQHEDRRQYDSITFNPGKEVPGVYNMWKGFTCEAIAGNCSLYLEHIKNNICSGNIDYYNYTLDWMARSIQRPNTTGQVAIVMRGRQGTGKGVFVKTLGSIFGRHFLQVSDARHLVGNFNAHLRDCTLLFGDEAFYAGDKKHESTLKMLVTEEMMPIEPKGVDVITANNFTHLLLASNSSWVVPADVDERRYFVLDVSDDQMQNSSYFEKIKDQIENGGREALLHFLLTRDLSKFNVRDFPRTSALQDQKMESMTGENEWWYNILDSGEMIPSVNCWDGSAVNKEQLHSVYLDYIEKIKYKRAPKNFNRFCKFIKDMVPENFSSQKQFSLGGQRGYYFQFPSLTECRDHFDERHGGPYPWASLGDDEDCETIQETF